MVDYTRLADFDELIVRCRDEQAREHIAEAVASYRAGAFRACIVTTWIAVVYDIIGKIRELASTGDAAAQGELGKLENIIKSHDVKSALGFESGALILARDLFSLLTQNEFDDLERLREDRQRCAHPSLNSIESPYAPPPELARLHLRSAVQHLLAHEPVQGKAALSRLIADVSSKYFPSSSEKARDVLSHGPLKRPKDSLVTNFTSALLSSLLREEDDDTFWDERRRRAAALNATRAMHRSLVEKTLEAKLNDIISMLPDENFLRAPLFLAAVPDTWHFLRPNVVVKIKNYTQSVGVNTNQDPLMLAAMFEVPELRDLAKLKIKDANEQALAELAADYARAEFVPRAIELYCESKSFFRANERAEALIVPLARFFTLGDLEDLLSKAAANGQVTDSHGFRPALEEIRDTSVISTEDFDTLMVKHGIHTPKNNA